MPPDRPGYWMYETSSMLRPAIVAYLAGGPMTLDQIGAMRVYLLQWIEAPVWRGSLIDELRSTVDAIKTRRDLARWLEIAVSAGVDPL